MSESATNEVDTAVSTADRVLGRSAAWYATRGLRVHPLVPGIKRPMLKKWQHRATTDRRVIGEWWSRWPGAGIGLATGAKSGFVVIDLDPRHGSDESILDIERAYGKLPATWRCATGGGGTHLYFVHPGARMANRVGVWAGVDVRADGGYVVAPPTVLDGDRRYVWESEHGPREVELAQLPDWLRSLLSEPQRAEGSNADHWAELVRNGADPGGRNDAVARLAGYLLRRRPAPRVVLELLHAWSGSRCRPPLDDEEISATVDSIARREMQRRTTGRGD